MEDRLKELRRVSAAGTLSQPAPFEAASSKPEPAAAGGLFRKRKASAAAVAAPQAAAAQGDIEMGAVGGKQQFMEGFFQDVEGVKVSSCSGCLVGCDQSIVLGW